ncbi:hypothetical protein L6R53_30100 [Myxococcota bacterium]|nr:hypothetical protein [Myxococcota bacterium]
MPSARSAFAIPSLFAVALGSTPAFAWEWDEEPELRQWRTATLDWAQDMAWDQNGESYTHAELEADFAPPPREAWCVENPAPTPQDCQTLNTRVRTWVRSFLSIPAGDPLPPGLPIMPAECSSICAS